MLLTVRRPLEMKKMTIESVSKMRGLLVKLMDILNNIPEEEWTQMIKSIQREKEKLTRMKNIVELGNIFILLFFLQEILPTIIEEESP